MFIAVRYYEDACKTTAGHILDKVKDSGMPTRFAPPPPGEKPKYDTVEELAEFALSRVDAVAWEIQIFAARLLASGFDPAFLESIESEPAVPNVSPREIYFWCLSNTEQYRRGLKDAAASGSPERVSQFIGKQQACCRDHQCYVRIAYRSIFSKIDRRGTKGVDYDPESMDPRAP